MPVDSRHPEFDANLPRWERARDASAGQDAVHAKGVIYLPKLAEQTSDEYKAYLLRTLYYNATGRTVDGLSGLIFRRPPTVDFPPAVEYLEDDVDTSGTPILSFAENVIEELVTVGRIGLLADYPPVQGIRTQAEEIAAAARPYVKTYCADSIINWRTERIGNKTVLTLAVLYEEAEDPLDEYTTKCVDQWRALRLVNGIYMQELWRKNPTKPDEFLMVEGYPMTPMMAGKPMDFIPFLVCGPMGVDLCVQKPPILDLADVNMSHYRTSADYEHGLHFTGLPTPYVSGHSFQPGEKFALGSTEVRGFADANAKASFLEFTGEGLGALSKRLLEKENMMAALGARMLAAEKRAAETAETAAIHRSGENGVLASLANAASSAMTMALTWCAQWAGVQDPVVIELNTDYLPAQMTAQDLTALVTAWQSGAVSWETMYDNLQRGEIARQGVDPEEEKAAIDQSGPPLGTMAADTGSLDGTQPTTGASGMGQASGQPSGQAGASPVVTPAAGPDFGPLLESIGSLVAALGTPQQPQTQAAPDFTGLIQAIQAHPAPVVNMPPITINVPEQPAAQINIAPAAITVEAPQVNVAPAQVTFADGAIQVDAPVTVQPAQVVVAQAKPGAITFTEDDAGNITGATLN